MTTAPDSVTEADRFASAAFSTALAVGRLEALATGADPRIRQQVVDERLHPADAIDGVADQLVGTSIQLALVALLENLHAPRHGPQRFLQVVRGDVGELLQVDVGAGQFVGGFPQFGLGTLPLGDVVDEFTVSTALISQAELADGQIHRDLMG